MKKVNKYYSLMFIPADNGKTFTLRIHKYILRSLILFLIIFFIGLLLLIFKSGEIAAKLQLLYVFKVENEKLLKENKQLRLIAAKFDRIETISKYLERLSETPAIIQKKKTSIPTHDNNIDNDEVTTIVNQQESTPQIPYMSSITTESGSYYNSIPNILPVEGWITRQFSSDSLGIHGHQGIDFAAASGVPIKATAPGVITDIRNDKYLGMLITVQHDHGFVTKYGHCSQILSSIHENVKRGQTIALVGNTGRSSAPHLHYEVIKDGKDVDPSGFFLSHHE